MKTHHTAEKFKNTTIANHFGYMCLRKTRSGKSNNGRDAVVFLRFEEHFVKLRFRDGLTWTVD